jgi:hypothetical protein
MLDRSSICAIALTAALGMTIARAQAFDEAKYPDLSGQWHRVGGTQWDPGKPGSRGQQAPLTAEYQAIFEKSLADQAAGGHGDDLRFTCRSSGMPRIMTAVYPLEIVISPKGHVHLVGICHAPPDLHRRTRRPEWVEPAFAGYSIGKWIDADGDGRYDVLEVETRHMKGPRDSTSTVFRSIRTTRRSSRSGFFSTRQTPSSSMTKSRRSTMR